MKIQRKFGELIWPNRVVLVMGLTLAAVSYYFPGEAALHGAGGSTIGLMFLCFAIFSICNWLIAICSMAATLFCLIGGFGSSHLDDHGKLFSALGAGCALMVLIAYLADRLRRIRRTKGGNATEV
jgi:hypothetical protein